MLFSCHMYAHVREEFKGKVILPLALEERPLEDILRGNLTIYNIKPCAQFLERMMEERQEAMYFVA